MSLSLARSTDRGRSRPIEEATNLRIIVQKFGGTSVSTPERRNQVADRVQQAIKEGYTPVVVVSAMGRVGDPYATDTFIQMAQSIYPETHPREMDMLIACGELISSVLVCNTLKARDLDALALTGGQAGIVTDENFGNAQILRVSPDHLLRYLRGGKIPVVAGFQGWTENGDITTLGRGGSDTTAAAIGAALRADAVDIYTDVDGIKTADPRIVPEAKTIPVTTYDEIVNLAHLGAKVIHPRAVEIAMRRNVPLRVKSTFEDSPGTLVTYSIEGAQGFDVENNGRYITGVTHLPDMAQIHFWPGASTKDSSDIKVFRAIADAGISVDFINVSPDRKSFIVPEPLADKTRRIIENLGFEAEALKGCAKVSIVGLRMRGVPGIMATMVEALSEAGVGVIQTSDSHVTICCLLKTTDMEKAIRALHRKFQLDSI